MGKKCASCESEKGAKSKGETEDLENIELKEQIASLVKQPRIIALMKRLECLGEAVE